MITDELLGFIRAQLDAGMNATDVEKLLIQEGGWDKSDVDEALAALATPPVPSVLPASLVSAAPPTAPISSMVAPQTIQSGQHSAKMEKGATEDFLGIFRGMEEGTRIASEPDEKIAESFPSRNDASVRHIKFNLDTVRRKKNNTPQTPDVPSLSIETINKELESAREQAMNAGRPENTSLAVSQVPQNKKSSIVAKRTMLSDLLVYETPPTPVTAATSLPKVQEIKQETRLETKKELAVPPPSTQPIHLAPPPQSIQPLVFEDTIKTNDKQNALSSHVLAQKQHREETRIPSIKEILLQDTKKSPSIPMEKSDIPSSTMPPPPPPPPFVARKETSSSIESREGSQSVPPVEEASPRPPMKKMMMITAGVVVLLGIIGGGVFAYMTFRKPDPKIFFDSAISHFLEQTSFSYKAVVSANLSLSHIAEDGIERSGLMQFFATSTGSLKSGSEGYGDGIHETQINGKLESGSFTRETAVDSDIRILDKTLYFHIRSFPSASNADPETLKTYWIRVDLAELSKELTKQGVSISEGNYGVFDGTQTNPSFISLLKKNMPFSAMEQVTDRATEIEGTYHYRLKTDPDRMLEFARSMMAHYFGQDFTTTEEERVRLKNAFEKISGEVWILRDTVDIARLSLSVDLDDDIVGFRTKGSISLSFDFSDPNKNINVVLPSPAITLEDFRFRTDNYNKLKAVRALDQTKADQLTAIANALSSYREQKGRYPSALNELYKEGVLSTTTVPQEFLQKAAYIPYIKSDTLNKQGQCTVKSKTCDFYHLGVNFEDIANPLLGSDADLASGIFGSDANGCGLEKNVSCYDITATTTIAARADDQRKSVEEENDHL